MHLRARPGRGAAHQGGPAMTDPTWKRFEELRQQIIADHQRQTEEVMAQLQPRIDAATQRGDQRELQRLQREFLERMQPYSDAVAMQLMKLPPPPIQLVP
jgi:uncharacterized membrane protein (DUF106 family)